MVAGLGVPIFRVFTVAICNDWTSATSLLQSAVPNVRVRNVP